MTTILKLLFTTIPFTFTIAAPRATAPQADEPVAFETVIKSFTNGPRKQIQAIVTTRREWKRIWKKAHSSFDEAPRCLRLISRGE